MHPIDAYRSRLLKLTWRTATGAASIVCASLGSPTEFTLLGFSGVRDIIHRPFRKRVLEHRDSCSAQLLRFGNTELRGIGIESFNIYYRAVISLSPVQSFSFYFDSMSARRRVGRQEKTPGGDWRYRDADTDELFDGDHPFG